MLIITLINELTACLHVLAAERGWGDIDMGMSDPVKRDLIFASLNIAKGLQVHRHDYQ